MEESKSQDDQVDNARPQRVLSTGDIRVIISNPVYRGIVRVRKPGRDCIKQSERSPDEYEEHRGRHPPIVPDELWFRANRVIKGPDKNHGRKAHPQRGSSIGLLQGLIICGCCDCAMSPGAATKRKRSGDPHRYYRCSELVKRGEQSECTTRQVSCDAVESAVVTLIQSLEANPAAFARMGFDPTSKKREEEKSKTNAEIFRLDALLQDKHRSIENFVKYLGKEGGDTLVNEVREAGTKAKEEIAKIEYERIQLEHRLHRLCARVPQLSELSKAFGRVARALQMSDKRGKSEIFSLIIRSISLRRIAIAAGPGSIARGNKRTFRMESEFRTDEVMRYGETEVANLLSQERFSDIVLKVTFEIHSNSKQQRVMLLEPNYSVVSSDFAYQQADTESVATKNEENPVQRALRWRKLLIDGDKTTTALAKDEKVSKGLISQHIALLELPQLIVDFLKDGRDRGLDRKISLRELQRMAQLAPADGIAMFHARMAGNPLQDVMHLGQ